MPGYKSGVHLTGIVPHELLDSGASARLGIPDLVQLSEKREPGKSVTARTVVRCRSAVNKPRSQTLEDDLINFNYE